MAIKIAMGMIKDGSNELERVANPGDIGLDGSLLKDNLHIYVNVNKLPHQLDMRIRIKGRLNLECGRCLDMYEKDFEEEFEMVYVPAGNKGHIIEDDYLRVYNPYMKYLDLTDDIRDFVKLAVPMRNIPDENEDGSCSWCGKKKEYWDSFISRVENSPSAD